jgi:hypothetical protein
VTVRSWYVDWAAPDGSVGGFVRIVAFDDRAWCWLYVVDEQGTVAVRDHDVPSLRHGSILARSEGLWCELVCEIPDEHWAVNAEAFGVRLDDPTDAWRGELGHRIPVGLELDWEAIAPARTEPDVGGQLSSQLGSVHGDIVLGDETTRFSGWGARDETHEERRRSRVLATAIVDEQRGIYVHGSGGYVWRNGRFDACVDGQPSDADGVRPVRGLVARSTTCDWRADVHPDTSLLVGGPAMFGGTRCTIEPLGHAGIPLSSARDERGLPRDAVVRALCRFSFDDRRVGHGWLERGLGEPV